jgi:hypothetical protein
MNPKLSKILTAALIMAMTLPIAALAAPPYDADAFWIEPDTLTFDTATTSIGDTFMVTVWANTSVSTFTWQVYLTFNTAHINVINVGYTGVGKSLFFTGHTTSPVSPVIDNSAGYVQHGESLLGADSKAPDCDSLFWVEFNITSAPPKGGSLNSLIDIDNANTYWLDPTLAEVTPMSKYGSSFTYTWSAPPSPNLAVVPDYVEYDQYTNATEEEFDVDIYAEGVNAAWYVHNVSFSLAYDDALLDVVSTTFDPLWATTSVTPTSGDYDFFVADPTSNPSGDVLLVTVRFEVIFQDEAPPRVPGEYNETALDIHDNQMFDTSIEIPLDPEEDGLVRIYAYVALSLAYLEVSSVTMGPEPCRGEVFNVTVSIKNLDWHWYLIGLEFRLAYDAFLIEPLATHILGPYLPSYAGYHNALPPPGTFWQTYNEEGPPDGPHVLAGQMIYPNATGWWNTDGSLADAWPGGPSIPGSGVVAILQFKVNYQSYGEDNMTSPLEIIDQLAIGLDGVDTQNIVGVPLDTPHNGNYTITTNLPGRVIDLYGGALNRGYGSHPFPAPYGGQGPDNPMDLIIPQAEVCLFAEVTYNYWPVQNKLVGFEVEDPYGGVLLKRTGVTNTEGIAMIRFEMPWPCDDPECLIGVWKVTATVDISDFRINDTLEYHYDYMVNIWKVTTDKFEYNHCEDVEITIEYGTHAQQWYPTLLSAVIMDELDVPIGIALVETEVGGAEFCSYTNFTSIVTIHIPKHAFAGIATIHVNAFDKDPTEGGVPWAPEFTPPPEIAIQPY